MVFLRTEPTHKEMTLKAQAYPTLNLEHQKSLKERRQRLRQSLDKQTLIVMATPAPVPTLTAERAFSCFFHQTGWQEHNAILVIRNWLDTPDAECLYIPSYERKSEIWNGPTFHVETAKEALGMGEVRSLDTFSKDIETYRTECSYVNAYLPAESETAALCQKFLDANFQKRFGVIVEPLKFHLDEVRKSKDAFEIEQLRKANRLSSEAHLKAMKAVRSCSYEFELQAELEYHLRQNGSARQGYGSIVASGDNGTCLHYVRNNCAIDQDDLVLIDAGGEWDHYTADITRTFPASGRFNQEQALVYEAVLRVQTKVIEAIKPGASFHELNELAENLLAAEVSSLGIYCESPEDLVRTKKIKQVYPHSIGHFLGLDVHDVGAVSLKNKPSGFPVGAVLTVEPGLYFQMDDPDIDPKWKGIAVRIEDNILVTDSGHENLTTIPKSLTEIEKIVCG